MTAAGVAYGLNKMEPEQVPEVGVMTSSFFVASLIHLPFGPTSVHLVFNGPLGIVLGWASFPAVLVALLLQAVLFQYGGLTTLGVNTLNLALPAVVVYLAFKRLILGGNRFVAYLSSFLAGAGAVVLSGLLVAAELMLTGREFWPVAAGEFVAHLPVMAVEGLITAFCLVYLRRLRPRILNAVEAGG